ncbi:MAG: ABC transporter permease [Verrucomicrobiota bacterium]|nr:ABC transporter permease [Verrucomicrobiota bacterium]
MRHYLHLLLHEIRVMLFAPATYAASTLFLLLMGYVFYSILQDNSTSEQEVIPLEQFFRAFSLPVLFMVPLLTMRSLAEERRLGTLETLMTTPVSTVEIVLAKFSAAYFFYLLLWAVALGFPILADRVLDRGDLTPLFLDQGVLIGGYIYVGLSGLLFIATGLLCSGLTRSQLVAAMLTFSLLLIFIVVLPALREQADAFNGWLRFPLQYFEVTSHLEDFARGIVDTRPVAYYLLNTSVVLGLATLIVEARGTR